MEFGAENVARKDPIFCSDVDAVRVVNKVGQFSYHGKTHKISEAFRGQKIGIRPTDIDGILSIYYRHQKIARIDLRLSNV